MTDRATESTVKANSQGEPVQWWGYSKEHGWVVLDRTVPCNAPALGVDLLFLRCRDATIFSEKRERWIPPHYRFAPNHILDLPPADADAATVELAEPQGALAGVRARNSTRPPGEGGAAGGRPPRGRKGAQAIRCGNEEAARGGQSLTCLLRPARRHRGFQPFACRPAAQRIENGSLPVANGLD